MIEKPKTIILDNNKQEVRLLIQSLEDKGFDVIHFDKQAEFKAYLEKNIVQFVLIDIELLKNDAKGFEIAEMCYQEYPEATRICISRSTVVEINATTIIRSINPNLDNERIFFAFGDKHKPNEVCELVSSIRSRQVSSDKAEILLDDSLKQLVDSKLSFLTNTVTTDTPDPSSQCFELIKRLSYKS